MLSDDGDWRTCRRHKDVDPDFMWGCPDCLAELRHQVAALEAEIAERNRVERETTELQAANVAALEAERDQWQERYFAAVAAAAVVEQAHYTSEATADRLRQALRTYGEHQAECAVMYPTRFDKATCTCGLAAVLAGTPDQA